MKKLSEERFLYLQDLLSAYKFSQLQSFAGVMQECAAYNIDPMEIMDYIADNIVVLTEEMDHDTMWIKPLKCPRCGKPTHVADINTEPGNQVGGDFKSVQICSDMIGCGYEEWSDLSTLEFSHKLYKQTYGTKEKKLLQRFHGRLCERKTTNKL